MLRGVFWIVEEELMAFPFDEKISYGIAKSGKTYNHKLLWEYIRPKGCNKAFDYYPRGRVEISNGKAIIFATPRICTDNIIDLIKKRYSLSEENGIHTVMVIPDHSDHYMCFLDRC